MSDEIFETEDEEDEVVDKSNHKKMKVLAKGKATKKVLKKWKDTISLVAYGPKNTGKSLVAYAMNEGTAKYAVLDFDGNTQTTIDANIDKKKHKNFKVWNVKKMLDFKSMKKTQIPKKAYDLTQKVEKILDEVEEFDPNYLIYDGYQRWVWVSEMAGRHLQDLAAFGGGNFGLWKERNFTLDRLFSAGMDIAKDALFVTVHERQSSLQVNKDGEAVPEPVWSGALKEEAQIEIRCTREVEDALDETMSFYVDVVANKLSSKTIMGMNVTRSPQNFFEWLIDTENDVEPMF